jgi:hypothetical protein
MNDCFEFNFQKYCFDIDKEIVDKYLIVNGLVLIKPVNKINGYLWVSKGYSEHPFREVKNNWETKLEKVGEGVRILYVCEEYDLMVMNYKGKEEWIYVYSDVLMNGDFEITILKNVNIIPKDGELFPTKKNMNMSLLDLNQFKSKKFNGTFEGNVI